MSKVLALIPARSGSKGVPDKNIRLLEQYPLQAWSIAACRKVKSIDRVIVSTDSSDYRILAIKYGAEAPFLRPAEFSSDCSTDYEVIIHTLNWLSDHKEQEPQYIVHMRPTTPLRDPALIDDAIQTFIRSPSATALRSVHQMSESAYKTLEITSSGKLKQVCCGGTALDASNNSRQSYPKTFVANGYVDVLSTAFIRQSGRLHGDHVIPFVTPSVVEVDTEDDFNYLEYQLTRAPEAMKRIFD